MARLAIDQVFGSLPVYTGLANYSQSGLVLGSYLIQHSGPGNEDKWVGPQPISVARPVETASAVPGFMPAVVPWTPNIDWIFLADNAAAAATRRIQLFTYDKTSQQFGFAGYVTCNFPFAGTQGNYTVRGLDVSYEKYTSGTVSVGNTFYNVTGTNTVWSGHNLCAGSRIAFNTTAPSGATGWYEISGIYSDVGMSLSTPYIGPLLSGVPYVIEDLRLFQVQTSSTATNAGLFMVAGLKYDNFATNGFNIAAATTGARTRAVYWLSDGRDGSNQTNQAYGGIYVDGMSNWTTQYIYTADYAASQSRFQKNNIRSNIFLTGNGREATTTGSWLFNTAQQGVAGTVSQNNNLVVVTPQHGPRSGTRSAFWATTTRVYSAPLTNITSGNATFQAGSMPEIPPGGSSTFAATSALSAVGYLSTIDKFLVSSSSATDNRHYITQYKEDSTPFDRIWGVDNKQLVQSAGDVNLTPFPNLLVLASSNASNTGMTYYVSHGTTALTNFMYAIPFICDWEYASASLQRAILPVMNTVNCNKFVRAYTNLVEVLGGRSGTNLGLSPEPVRVYYRTTGISDNSGSWTLLDYSGDLSTVNPSATIQFMIEFRVIGTTCIPARVVATGVIYDDLSTDTHYQPSTAFADRSGKKFAWRFSTAFGTAVPNLRVRLYDAVSGGLLVDDNTDTPTGTFEESADDGANWNTWTTTDKLNETTYLRYTPASLGDNIKVRALLTVL